MVEQQELDRSPNPIDVHVGTRVRLRRKAKGVSQDALAGRLKLTFQQVQKYERGSNRISASKLFEIAQALETPVAWFFEGLPEPEGYGGLAEGRAEFNHEMTMTPEAVELATAFSKIRRGRIRSRVLSLVKSIAGEDDGEEAAA